MNCDPERIYLYLENELNQVERTQVEAHLRECSMCAHCLRAQRAVLDDLDGLWDVPTPVWLEGKLTERAYEDLTATVHNRAERSRALIVVAVLSAATVILLSLGTVTEYLLQFYRGVRVVGGVVVNMATVFLKGLAFVTIGVVHGLADDTQVTPLLAVLLAAILSLVLVRLLLQFDVSTNKR